MILVVLAAALLVTSACGRSQGTKTAPPALVERARLSMGSELRLTAVGPDSARIDKAFDAVFQEFDRLEQLMSNWRDTSEVSRLNAAAGERPVPASAELREVLAVARQVSDWTSGTFDVTFGALTGLWKFDHDQDNRIPSRDAVQALLPLINYRDILVDDKQGTAFLKRKGMRVHLGGIGKGYAVDRGARILHEHGVDNFMIQAGGDLYVAGTRGDRPWSLGIRDPRGPVDQIFAAIELSQGTLSTSGDYERFFIKDGRRYHHILDPRTGEPAGLCRSVTLVTARAVIADALAKGVFILGPEKGMALIEDLPGVEAVIVSSENQVLVSSGLKGKVTILTP